jgi:iron complex outermembrane receptor protein
MAVLALLWCSPTRAHGQQSADAELGARAVVSATPLMGGGVSADRLPSDVQLIDQAALDEQHALGVQAALNARAAGVALSDAQSNPLQPDLSFRGFVASPLLGTPQGIAVYQNGVRVNEPFGDVVQWDLVPDIAISRAQLAPGANPVFGLNSLGGSLAFELKNGYRFDGLELRGSGGSFGRARAAAQYGAVIGDVALYEALDSFSEEGFREHSGSRALRFFGDVRHAERRFEIGANLTLASNRLRGNGPAPVDLLARSRSAVFTWPDITDNDLLQLSVQSEASLTDALSLQSVAYVRHFTRGTLNGDEADFESCQDAVSLCRPESTTPLRDEAGRRVALMPGATPNALLHTTDTASTSYGATLQATLSRALAGRENLLSVGTSIDAATSDFAQRSEVSGLSQSRGVEGTGAFLGSAAFRTSLGAQNLYLGLYATDTFSVTERLHVTLAARLNRARIALEDRLGRALDGEHGFTRLNPAAGVAYQLPAGVTLFGGYSESNRAPSAAELACADPSQPCRVPNAFLSDPPLAQVVSRSLEAGVRGRQRAASGAHVRWSLAAFGARNYDDILFVAGSHVGTGFFRNAGKTQRAGLEASVDGGAGMLRFFLGYQLLRATFEDALTLPGPNHPLARVDASGSRVLDVKPGARLPGLPAHALTLGFRLEPIEGLSLGPDARLYSAQYLRGDEANLVRPVPGYFVLGAHASYRVVRWLTLFVDVENLLDAKYATFGVLGHPGDVLPFASDPRFLGPGAPFGIWFGAELRL